MTLLGTGVREYLRGDRPEPGIEEQLRIVGLQAVWRFPALSGAGVKLGALTEVADPDMTVTARVRTSPGSTRCTPTGRAVPGALR